MGMKFFLNLVLALSMVVSTLALAPETARAQRGGAPVGQSEAPKLTGTRKQLATIIFSGLAGAVLGLSTLSFYGRPQDHLSNIAVGFAFGIISGTIYTTYQAARAPYEYYDIGELDRMGLQPSYVLGQSDLFPEADRVVRTNLGYSWTF